MTTEPHNERTDDTADAAVTAPRPIPGTDHPAAFGTAPQARDETAVREWEGLPPDAVVLIPQFAPPPMRCPDRSWGILVTAVDILTDPDHSGDAALFAGLWVTEQPPADNLYAGDLVVRLTDPPDATSDLTAAEMLLAYKGQWRKICHWPALDTSWPRIIAPTAAAIMGFYRDITEASTPSPTTPPIPIPWARRGIADLIDAGILSPGQEFVWDRRHHGVRHTARVRGDGTLQLADGRVFANPCGATTALGGNHQNGWTAFRRSTDNRTLHDLREELRARRAH